MIRRYRTIGRSFAIYSESGVTAIEYAMIAALIAIAMITATYLVGTNLNTTFGTIAGKLGSATEQNTQGDQHVQTDRRTGE
jgi:pilus assembly protein Flp/PilA